MENKLSKVDNWGYIIKRLREERGLTQGELSLRSALGRGHISRIERGNYINPKQKTFELLARGLGLTINKLNEEIKGEKKLTSIETPEQILERLRLATPVSVPVYTEYPLHAGELMMPVEYIYRAREKTVGKNIEAYIVKGNCLEPLINEGDVIIIDRDGAIDVGDIVACLTGEGLHLGRLRKIADELWLENKFSRIHFNECTISAPVIEIIKRLK